MRGLPWLRVDVDMPDHPKMARLADLLDVDEAWPRVMQLWCWAAKVAPTGDLTGLTPRAIARAAGWRKDADRFVTALRDVGLLDADNKIHDWDDQQGKYLERLEKDRERKKKPSAGVPTEFQRKDAGTSTPVPVPRVRDARAGGRDGTGRDEEREVQEPSSPSAGDGRPEAYRELDPATDELKPGEPAADLFGAPPKAKAPKPKTERKRDEVMDAVMVAYHEAFNVPGDPLKREWSQAEVAQLAKSRKRWPVETICAAIRGFASGGEYERRMKLVAMLTPDTLETRIRATAAPAPAVSRLGAGSRASEWDGEREAALLRLQNERSAQ